MKVLVFDIWGDYAHFRKYFTTSSPLSFSFPPPPTIAGILGAILGTDKKSNKYLEVFGNNICRIALQILKPINKIRMGINLLETKGTNLKLPMSDKNFAPHTQIRTEFVKNPVYRIYIFHKDDNIFKNLSKNAEEHKSVYTVSLGLSELLANIRHVGVYEVYELSIDEPVELITPITVSNLASNGLHIEEGKKYYKEKMPIIMNTERIVKKYDDVIYEPDGKTIKAKVKSYYRIENGENIAFF